MEYNKINFQVLEECLIAAESKEQIQSVFIASATNILDSEIFLLKSDNLPQTLKTIPKIMNISNEKALIVSNYISSNPPLAYSVASQSNEGIHRNFNAR